MKRKEKNTKQAHIYFNEREFKQLEALQKMTEEYLLNAPPKAEIFRIGLNFLYTEAQKDPATLKRLLKEDIRED